MTLSDRQLWVNSDTSTIADVRVIPTDDIKEFIKKLKEELREMGCNAQKVSEKAISRGYRIALSECLKEIDKLAGEELSK